MNGDAATLALQRCHTHPAREAVARCPSCKRFFCRECITEHDNRVLCAACLAERTTQRESRFAVWRRLLGWALRPVQIGVGFLFAWLCFYYLGSLLIRIPSAFHEGTIW